MFASTTSASFIMRLHYLCMFVQVTEHICKLAKKGMTPSQIGVLLRDSHGIPQVRASTSTSSSSSSTCRRTCPWSEVACVCSCQQPLQQTSKQVQYFSTTLC
jgi:hypothetical protein